MRRTLAVACWVLLAEIVLVGMPLATLASADEPAGSSPAIGETPSRPARALANASGSESPAVGEPRSRATEAGIDLFEKKIRPVLVEKCYQCHASAKGAVKGGLALDTSAGMSKGGESGAVIVPRDPDASLLIEALRYEGPEMPPKEKLPDAVIADFVQWVRLGAPDPRTANDAAKSHRAADASTFWAFQPPKQIEPSAVRDAAWPKSQFDRFILARLEAENLKPVADAGRLTLLRRVTFDLTGLPPTADDVSAFERDGSPAAFAAAVDRLLASPQFGERWGRHWLDVARYAESTGKERNYRFSHAWRYRDWVIDAVNADLPYDEFITAQIAGDLLPASTPEQKNSQTIATGFLAVGPKSVNERDAELYLMDQVDDQIDVACRAVLATTVGCARCHDHKFDPIPTADYYALAGIFRSTEVLSGVGTAKGKSVAPAMLVSLAPVAPPTADAARALQEQLERDRQAREQFVRERQEKIDAQLHTLKRLRAEGTEGAKSRIEKIEKALARDRREAAMTAEGASDVPASLQAMGVRDRAEPSDCAICIRGEVGDRGDSVPRGFVAALGNPSDIAIDSRHSGRLELARWMTDRRNPLTARVMANRVWYHLIGKGLVESLDNFGALGDRPSHPELLDSLALYLMDHGWSVKQLIREIVLSRTYQLSSDHDEHGYQADPANRLVWRANRRRLDAESIRDAVLAASGDLDRDRPQGSLLGQSAAGVEIGRKSFVDQSVAESSPYRSVYLPLARNAVPEMLSVFDAADPSLVVGEREVTTVATQALFLMNSKFVLDHSQRIADELLKMESLPIERRIEHAYRLIVSRPPTAAQRERASRFLREFAGPAPGIVAAGSAATGSPTGDVGEALAAWASLCQVLFASAEFRYLY